MSALALANVSKRYGAGDVLRDFTLEVAEGEFVALLGASGCGKTTALRVVAGLERPDAGTVSIDGRDVTHEPPDKRDLAMVFQNFALYPQLSVARNIALPLEMRRLSPWQRLPGAQAFGRVRAVRAGIDADVARIAADFGLTDLLAKRPAQLSGGQKQRTALARAMVRRPRLLLMDEPLSSLDSALRHRLRREIVALHKSVGATVLYVTHDQVEAMTMADRIAVIAGGRVVQVASPARLYDDPAHLHVAEMLGMPMINMFNGVARDGRVEAGGRVWPIDTRRRVEEPVTVAFRAEHATLAPDDGASGDILERIEHAGADRLAFVRTREGAEAAIRHPPGATARPGDRVQVQIDAARLMVFDMTGSRIRHERPAT